MSYLFDTHFLNKVMVVIKKIMLRHTVEDTADHRNCSHLKIIASVQKEQQFNYLAFNFFFYPLVD